MHQLWVYTICINEINTKNVYFYVHYEGVAHKSLDEVCSWLHYYIQKANTEKTCIKM